MKTINVILRALKQRVVLFGLFTTLFLFLVTLPVAYSAEKVRVVEGLIQDVTDDSIEVRGKYYNLTGALLVDTSGKKVSKQRLVKGKKVEIFFENNKITSILIHEYMVE